MKKSREGVRSGGGGYGDGERRIKVIVKMQKKVAGEGGQGVPVGGGGPVGVGRSGGQGGCEGRIEVIVKMQNKKIGGRGQGGGERRIKVIMKIQKKSRG